jgi:hypothetical protein
MHPKSKKNPQKSSGFRLRGGWGVLSAPPPGVLLDGYPRSARFWMRLLADARSRKE